MASYPKRQRFSRPLRDEDLQNFFDNLDNDEGNLTDSDIDFEDDSGSDVSSSESDNDIGIDENQLKLKISMLKLKFPILPT